MTERLLSAGLWTLGIGTVLIVSFAIAAMVAPADTLGTTLPRGGWVTALVGWGVGGGMVVVTIARVAGDEWPARTGVGVMTLALAVAAGVAVELTVMQWALERFGVQAADPDLIGWSSLLSPMVVLVGLTALAAAVLPGAGGTAARAISVLASAGVLIVVASNVPGALDDVTPLGVPMGIAMGFAAGVALAAVALTGSSRSPQPPER